MSRPTTPVPPVKGPLLRPTKPAHNRCQIAIPDRLAMAIALLLCALAPATAWSAGGAGLTLRRPRALHVEMMATTATGLVYVETVTGNGRTPAPDDSVTVHYTGKLVANGKVFDSSFSRGEPTTFKVNQVIKGWQEGLGMMKEGGKATLTIPAALAYGSRQMNDIPPNSELIFEIELIKVGGGKSGGFDISELIPGDYLARSFASASVDKKNASTQSPAETLQKSAPFLLGFVVIGMASYFGVLPR